MHCFQFKIYGTIVCQHTETSRATLSSGTAEYMGLSRAIQLGLAIIQTLLRCFPRELHPRFPVPLYCDSTVANAIATNYSLSKKVKHLDTAYNFARDYISAHIFECRHEKEPTSDMTTKAAKSRPEHECKTKCLLNHNKVISPSWDDWLTYIKTHSDSLN